MGLFSTFLVVEDENDTFGIGQYFHEEDLPETVEGYHSRDIQFDRAPDLAIGGITLLELKHQLRQLLDQVEAYER